MHGEFLHDESRRDCEHQEVPHNDQAERMGDREVSERQDKHTGEDSEEEIERIIDEIPDPVGTFYRFGLPNSTLKRKIIKDDKANHDRPDNKA